VCLGDNTQTCVQVIYIVQSSVDHNNKTLSSGSITVAWSSNPKLCNPMGTGLSKDRCFLGDFEWTPTSFNCKNLSIYDTTDPSKLLFGVDGLCNITPALIFLPNTSYYVPRLSALRLTGFATIVPLTDGVTEDGQPKIVDHILGDFDMEVFVTIATFNQLTGPGIADFVGFIVPIAFGFFGGKLRWGYSYISPLQRSFAPTEKGT
jgi:hypothetical protein